MNLAKLRSVVEHDSHYVVDDGVGKPFKVAKRGLSAATREKIAAVASGKLARYNEGGLAESLPPEPAPMESSSIGVDAAAKAGISREAYSAAVEAAQPQLLAMAPKREDFTPSFASAGPFAPIASAANSVGESLSRAVYGAGSEDKKFEAARAEYERSLPTLTHELAMQKASVAPPAPAAPVGAPAPTPVQVPPENAFLPAKPSAPAPAAKTGGASATALPAVPAMPAAPVIPAGEASPEFKAALDDQKAAAAALGDVRLREAEAAKAAAAERQVKLDEIAKASEIAKKDALDDYALKEKAYRENEIDPNKMFGSMSTGRKIAAALSLFAGGFASAYTGKNYALDIFNKAIDDDIAAQKDKKNSQYNMYIRAGDDAKTAEAKARADLSAAFGAKLESDAAKLLPEKAQADVKKAAADMRMQANNQLMAEIDRDTARKTEAVLNPLRVQNEQARLGATQFGMEADRARLGMQGEQIGLEKRRIGLAERDLAERKAERLDAKVAAEARQAVTAAFQSGQEIPDKVIPLLPEADQARMIKTPTGYVAAMTKEGAGKANEAKAIYDRVIAKVADLREIRERNPGGVFGRNRGDKGRADQIYRDLMTDISVWKQLGAISAGDREIIEGILPDITEFSPTDYTDAKIDQLTKSMGSSLAATQGAYMINRGSAVPAAGLTARKPGG